MKDFFTQCLLDLYAITGIEQVRWMQNDVANGKRDFDLCVDAMVQTCKMFPYIVEEDQQAIIKRMMIEDKNYKALNSRTIYAWLDANRGTYYRGQTHFEEDPNHKPAEPEVADKYIEEWRTALAKVGDPEIRNDGIKDQRIQQMKDQFNGIACKHTGLRIEISDTEDVCNDCGKAFPRFPSASSSE